MRTGAGKRTELRRTAPSFTAIVGGIFMGQPIKPVMKKKEIDDAAVALFMWFRSQRISVGDAVRVMCRTLPLCIQQISPAHFEEGLKVTADLIRSYSWHPRKKGEKKNVSTTTRRL